MKNVFKSIISNGVGNKVTLKRSIYVTFRGCYPLPTERYNIYIQGMVCRGLNFLIKGIVCVLYIFVGNSNFIYIDRFK